MTFAGFVIENRNNYSVTLTQVVYSDSHNRVITYKYNCSQGYTLLSFRSWLSSSPDNYVLLVDMDGNEIRRWNANPHPAKMLPGGLIISSNVRYTRQGDITNLTQLDWDGNVVWDFSKWVKDSSGQYMARQHHDFQREGNPVGYYAPGQDFVPFGKTLILSHNMIVSPIVSRRKIIDDVIYEVEWNGALTGFEWHASEHINEMGLNLRSRLGIWLRPGGSGMLLGIPRGDWLHINSVSFVGNNKWYDKGDKRFNPGNIMICSRHCNLVAIINRETGDIVWRVGPVFSKKTIEEAN